MFIANWLGKNTKKPAKSDDRGFNFVHFKDHSDEEIEAFKYSRFMRAMFSKEIPFGH